MTLSIEWNLSAQTQRISTALKEEASQGPMCLLHEVSKRTWNCRLGHYWGSHTTTDIGQDCTLAFCTLICPFCQVFFIHMHSRICEGSCQWIDAPCFSPAFPAPAGAQATCRPVAAWGAHVPPARVVLIHALSMVASIFSARGSILDHICTRLWWSRAPDQQFTPPAGVQVGFHGASGMERAAQPIPCVISWRSRTPSWTPVCSGLLETSKVDVAGVAWAGHELCYPGRNTRKRAGV